MSTVSPPNEATIATPATARDEPDDDAIEPHRWFDRSSIIADLMVTLEGVSEEDWWKYAPENRVCEYLDGVVYMPSPATDEHQDDVGFWFTLLNLYTHERQIGCTRLGPGVLKLAPRRNPEPDVFAVPYGDGPHDSPAYLVVETLSKSTRKHDMGRKRDAFQDARIPEIVYVDLEGRRLIVHRLAGDLYTTEVHERGTWRSTSVPGFWMDVAWLWETPLPWPLRCLQVILAVPPA